MPSIIDIYTNGQLTQDWFSLGGEKDIPQGLKGRKTNPLSVSDTENSTLVKIPRFTSRDTHRVIAVYP